MTHVRPDEPPAVEGGTMFPLSRRAALGWLLLGTLLLRGAAVFGLRAGLRADPDGYRMIAENLRQHGTFGRTTETGRVTPTAFRPPLYPLLLTATAVNGTVPPAAVAVLHVLIALATVTLTWRLAFHCGLGHRAVGAGALVACDPILVNQSGQVMTESLATLLAVAAWLALVRLEQTAGTRRAVLAGVALGLAVLCRPAFLVFALLVMVVLAARVAWRRLPLRAWTAVAVALAATVAPWIVRNALQAGAPIATTTHGGYTLLLANNPDYYRYLREDRSGAPWSAKALGDYVRSLRPQPTSVARERELDRRLYQLARQTIREQPRMFARACLVRWKSFFDPMPQAISQPEPVWRRAARYAVALWYVALYGLVVASVVAGGRRAMTGPWLWVWLMLVALVGVHSIYWTNLRMRAPIMPGLCLLAVSFKRSA